MLLDQRMRKRCYKTLGTSVISCPLSLPFLIIAHAVNNNSNYNHFPKYFRTKKFQFSSFQWKKKLKFLHIIYWFSSAIKNTREKFISLIITYKWIGIAYLKRLNLFNRMIKEISFDSNSLHIQSQGRPEILTCYWLFFH